MKKICILYVAFFLLPFLGGAGNSLFAQNFLWGRSGGGSNNSGFFVDRESVKDIATDVNGNVYILSTVDSIGLKIAGQSFTGYGVRDIMLASFKSDGTFRWAKIVGGSGLDIGFWLAADEKDGVYFTGQVVKTGSPANIDTDAVSPQNYQLQMLVKYDTAGKFQWYRHPDPDTLTSWNNSAESLGMDVDKSGNVYWLMNLAPGGYGGGVLNVANRELYILKYSASGGFSYIKPDVTGGTSLFGGAVLTLDETNDRFYLSGFGGGLTIGGSTLKGSMYIGCFKLDGSLLWKKEDTTGSSIVIYRPAIDGEGNIYLAGSGSKSTIFNGQYITQNTEAAFVLKMDKNGKTLWVRTAPAEKNESTTAVTVALLNKNQVITAGIFNGLLEWQGSGIPGYHSPKDYGEDMFITRFDVNTGTVLGIDRVGSSFGYSEIPYSIVADGKGHVYIGGEFKADMFINQSDTIRSNGGESDWFVVKYGDMWPATIDETITGYEVKIYPNPASGQLIIEGAKAGTEISLLNMFGQQVYKAATLNGYKVIDVSSFPGGNYILQLRGNNGHPVNKKIVKQ